MTPSPLIELIDTHQFGQPQSGAVYLMRGSRSALVESGTAASIGTTLDALSALDDFSPDFIFLTHIHLDHAGGAGHLARAFPQTKIVVHKRAIHHLADPRQLLDSVRLAAPDFFHLYGEPLPIPEHQLIAVSGGEVFSLDRDIHLEVIAAPGHAPHHICFYEHASRTLFTGDAAGNWNNSVDVPLTVPPRFNLTHGLKTLQCLKRLAPTHLAFTHFGIAHDAVAHLERYERQLDEWFEEIRRLSIFLDPADIVNRFLNQPRYQALPEIERDLLAMCIRGACLSLQTGST